MIEATITRRIDFCDIDLTGAMWHGNYCKYYEAARCQLLENMGFPYKEIQKNNHQIPVVRLFIKYSKPCKYNQEITITARLIRADHFLEFQYIIRDKETEEILSRAETKHVFYNSLTQRALIKPPKFVENKVKLIEDLNIS